MRLYDIRSIHDKLHASASYSHNENATGGYYGVKSKDALSYLRLKLNASTNAERARGINRLISKIDPSINYLPTTLVEKFCLSALTKLILREYSLHIAQAYALAFVILEKFTSRTVLVHKLCSSGVLKDVKLHGQPVLDVERLAGVVLDGLHQLQFLKCTENGSIIAGTQKIILDEYANN